MKRFDQTCLDEYAQRFADFCVLTRKDGVLEMRLQSGGETMKWGPEQIFMLPELFRAIEHDDENDVLIWTGTGDTFMRPDSEGFLAYGVDTGAFPASASAGGEKVLYQLMYRQVHRILRSVVDLSMPVIGAINGPMTTHPEILMSDLVIAAEGSSFTDRHWAKLSLVPGDGVHFIYRQILGPVRARYFLLTGENLSAPRALELGMISEIVPGKELAARAHELAHTVFLSHDRPARRLARSLLMQPWRELVARELALGMAHETLATTM